MQRIDVPGMGIVEFPDGMTDEQITAAIQANQPKAPDRNAMVRDELMRPVKDLGNLGAGAIRGAGSIGATLLYPVDKALDLYHGDRDTSLSDLVTSKKKLSRNEERRQAMDAALSTLGADTDSIAYGAGKLGGEIAGTAGTGGLLAKGLTMLPGAARVAPVIDAVASHGMKAGGLSGVQGMLARMLGGGISGGAGAGLIDPESAGQGAALGAALPPALAAAGKVGGAIGSALRPAIADPALAGKAIGQYNIPLGLSDIAKSPMLKGARSALDDSLLVGRIGQGRREAVQEGFNRAVGDTFGAGAPKLTPQVMDQAKQRLGSEFNRIWGGNTLKIDSGLIQDLQRIQGDATSKLNPEQAGQVSRTIQNLLQKANGLDIDGAFANNWQSELRMIAEGEKGLHQKLLTDLRKSALDAFNRSIPAQDAAALSMTKAQYKAFKTVEQIVRKAEAGVGGREVGDVAAGLLPGAVMKSYGNGISGSPFADLAQIGSKYVANRVPQTGGSARAAVQNTLTGAGLTAGYLGSPILPLLGIGGAAGVESLLSSPGLAKQLTSPQAQSLLRQLELERLLSLSAPALANQ